MGNAITPRKKCAAYVLSIFLWLLTPGCATPASQPDHDAVAGEGREGIVSSAHPVASRAGIEILKAGGNAFEAAVAVAATLNVVEPMMSGMGGYGTLLVYQAREDRVRFLNSSGRIPQALDSDVFRAPTDGYMENRRGAKAVSTPANLRAWEALAAMGNLNWPDLFKSAIEAAEEGFEISQGTAWLIGQAYPDFPEHARSIYGRAGTPLREKERLIQKDLARSLRLVAEKGADAFHGGELGRAVVETLRFSDGFLTLDDLREAQAEWWEPISIDYRGYRVVTASPPATAFPSLIRLGIMSRFDVAAMGHNSASFLHHFAEASKHAFWCRLAYAGDPEVQPPPLDRLLSPEYWAEEGAAIDPTKARPFEPPQTVTAVGQHTTHFVVADHWGNVVSATQTLGNSFGSRIMAAGTGIWLNNSLAYSTFEPRGNPMDAHAGRRKLSGDCPTMIFRGGRLWAALGTPGGHTIGQTVPQMVMNLIDFEMEIEDALAAARISFIEPDQLAVEEGISEATRQQLRRLGHKLRIVERLGNAHGLTIEYRDGKPSSFRGAADPRGIGEAVGY